MGSQKWQLLFGKDVATGGSEGMAQPDPMIDFAELDAHNFYEPEPARMIRTAQKRDAPQGCVMRPYQSDELYRLTLRRYEEIDDATRLAFYFTPRLSIFRFSGFMTRQMTRN
jgi:hypothetical protein